MKNTFEVINWSETCRDKFFKVAITNEDGTHTDIFSSVTLMKFIQKGVKFSVDMENEELVNELEQLGYVTVAEDEEGIFDIYVHTVSVDDYIEVDFAGTFKKTYKREASAIKYAESLGYCLL